MNLLETNSLKQNSLKEFAESLCKYSCDSRIVGKSDIEERRVIQRKSKRTRKKSRSYAPPSRYSHLSAVPDYLQPNLVCIFIGLNPGVTTALQGHHFASPTNNFWKFINEAEIVPRPMGFLDDYRMPEFGFGMTNIIDRPTAECSELSKEEMILAVKPLEEKIAKYAPKMCCVIGKGIYEAINRAKTNTPVPKGFEFGIQKELFGDVPMYVVPSTSGRVAAYSRTYQLQLWKNMADIFKQYYVPG